MAIDTAMRVRKFSEANFLPRPGSPTTPAPGERAAIHLEGVVRSLAYAGEQLHKMCAETGGDVCLLRLQLIVEEVAEVAEAIRDRDLVGLLHELSDLQYVVDGTYVAFGLDRRKDEAFQRIHEANMSKLGRDGKPVLSEGGRVIKGPDFQPANVEDLV